MRKIGVTYGRITDEWLTKIKAAAPDFEVITAKRDDAVLLDCEVVFGHLSADVLTKSAALKWLHTQSAGVDAYFRRGVEFPANIALTNSAGAYGITIAEHLLTTALMLMRRMPEYGRLQTERKWEYLGLIDTLYGSTVTVVGLGDIGGNFAARCKAMGAKVRGVVRNSRVDLPNCVDELFTADNLDAAISDADVVALCLPATDETVALFDETRIGRMKHGSYILNVGRGSAIDGDALAKALHSGHLRGAGLDVTQPEPLPADHPLWDAPNLIITPHVSGGDSTNLTSDLIVGKFLRYLQAYAAGLPFERAVDKSLGY